MCGALRWLQLRVLTAKGVGTVGALDDAARTVRRLPTRGFPFDETVRKLVLYHIPSPPRRRWGDTGLLVLEDITRRRRCACAPDSEGAHGTRMYAVVLPPNPAVALFPVKDGRRVVDSLVGGGSLQ